MREALWGAGQAECSETAAPATGGAWYLKEFIFQKEKVFI